MKIFVSLSLVLLILFASAQPAFASRVDILPRKVLMDSRQRSADITLLNMSDKPSVVRIEIISYAQQPDGTYKELEAPLNPAFDPQQLVRISPKQFTLPAAGRQKVRLSVQKPADLPPGDYRFHVKALSFDTEDFSVRRNPTKGSGVSVKVNLGVVIPVVVRNGDLTTAAKLGNVSYLSAQQSESNQPSLKVDITRTGTAGVLGTITVYDDAKREIGKVNNVNVFSEVKTRTLVFPLKEVPTGNMHLVYTNDFGDRGIIDELVVQK